MKILLDEGLPRTAAPSLRKAGFHTEHVVDLLGPGAPDTQILQVARDKNLVVITLDADFHTILALTGAAAPSVIRIRVEALKAADLVALLTPLLQTHCRDLESGIAMSVDHRFVRLRTLPLGQATEP